MFIIILVSGLVGVICLINYWCETAPTIEEAQIGWGIDCFNCNEGNEACNQCPVKQHYLKTQKYVAHSVMEKK